MINKKTRNNFIKVNNFLFTSIAFLLPLQKELVSLAVGLFFITSLVVIDMNGFISRAKKVLPLFIYFLISVLALSYTENISIGLHKIETQLTFFALPLAVVLSNIDIEKITKKITTAFIEGCSLAVLIGVIHASFLYLETNNIDSFFYNNMAVYTHNSHFAMYLNLAVIFLYRVILYANQNNYLNIFIAVVFNVVIIALISKTGIITLLFTNIIFLYYLVKQKKYKFSFVIFIFFISSSIVLYNKSTTISSRISEFTTSLFDNKKNQVNSSTNSRIKVLEISAELIQSSPLVGYGVGDVQSELNKKYVEYNYIDLKKRSLNTHNMYLQRFISTGIIGLFSLLLLLVQPIFILKNKSKSLLFFILLIAINIGTEAMFIKREGVIFFVFFVLFFIFSKKQTLNT